MKNKKYDVVITFAGEQRAYAENLANIIRHNGFSVFYDDFEQSDIWGEELNKYLNKVYGGDSQYCVMFISEQYKKKPYPYRERLAAINKFYENMGTTYILPVRFDDTNIEELPNSIAYIDIRKKDLVQIQNS